MIQDVGQPARAWRIYSGGQEHGPYTREEIDGFVFNGQLSADAMMCGPGMSEWQSVYPQSEPTFSPTPIASRRRKNGNGPLLVIFGIMAVVAVVATIVIVEAVKSGAIRRSFDKSDAIQHGKTAVLARLKAPSTAEFPHEPEATEVSAGHWRVSGEVDAQNSLAQKFEAGGS